MDVNLFIEMLSLRKDDVKLKKEQDMQHSPPKIKGGFEKSIVDIPKKMQECIKNTFNEKISHKVYKVNFINQLDLLMKHKKLETSKI